MGTRFFSIIHAAIIQDGQLALPKEFVRKFGKGLSDVAVITIPTGKFWYVQLKKAKGELLFGIGWKKFMDYFPLGVGHFLIFEYSGKSRFNVFVCDVSASEIKYPPYTRSAETPNHKSVLPASATHGIDYAENLVVHCPRPISSVPSPANIGRGRKTNNAFVSQSGNPAFKITMQPAYVRQWRTVVHVPVGFTVFREVNCDIVTLKNSEGRTWDVGVSTYGAKQTKLTAGWSDFVLGNQLEVGDVCVFELTDRDNVQMDVTIMRAGELV